MTLAAIPEAVVALCAGEGAVTIDDCGENGDVAIQGRHARPVEDAHRG